MESQNNNKTTSKSFRWNDDMVDFLLKALQKYKSTMAYQGKDFDGDRPSQYSFLRKEMATRYQQQTGSPFGPISASNLATEGLSEEEIATIKRNIKEEEKNIKCGYNRVLEKVKEIRQKFSSAAIKGTRSGSGRVVLLHFDLLKDIYGGSASATSLKSGIDSTDVNNVNEGPHNSFSNIATTSTATPTGHSFEDDEEEHFEHEENQQPTETNQEEVTNNSLIHRGKRKNDKSIPQLIDDKRRHLEKRLSASERDAVLMREAREDITLRKEIISAINESNKSFSASMKDVSESMKVLGETMKMSMELLAKSPQNLYGATNSHSSFNQSTHFQNTPFISPSTYLQASTPIRTQNNVNTTPPMERNLQYSTNFSSVPNLSGESSTFLSHVNSSYEHGSSL